MSKVSPKTLGAMVGAAALVFLILYTGGFLATGLIEPGRVEAAPGQAPAGERVQARAVMSMQYYRAVGTVRPRTEASIEAQVSARVKEVKVRAGDEVRQGALLVVLDDRQLKSQLGQAEQGMAEARAALDRADLEHRRVKSFVAQEAATTRDLEQANEALRRAQARMSQASQQVEEARIALGYTRITAPEAGQVVKRLIEPGDLALPGKPLVVLQTTGAQRLEAVVPEGLIGRVTKGQELLVELPSLNRDFPAVVEEIAPSADPATRTFLVKAGLPQSQSFHTGMFGRLLLPVGEEKVVVIPQRAVIRVGQLSLVNLESQTGVRRIYVTLGREMEGGVEVLSGLTGGETLVVTGEGINE